MTTEDTLVAVLAFLMFGLGLIVVLIMLPGVKDYLNDRADDDDTGMMGEG